MTETVKWQEVDSSNIVKVGRVVLGDKPVLLVVFHNGTAYAYFGVTRQRAVAMMHSDSVGKYLNQKIKGHFDYTRVV